MTGGGENQRKMPQNLATGPEIHHSHHQTGLAGKKIIYPCAIFSCNFEQECYIFCWAPSEAVREHILTPT
uniref:Uncharacterized protein n=1 Tax=Cebus imitator TaxID=2715852 RepID=A0A2K5QZ18_CEBIM